MRNFQNKNASPNGQNRSVFRNSNCYLDRFWMPFRNMRSKFFFEKFFFEIHFRISKSVHLGIFCQDGRPQVRPILHRCAVKFEKKRHLVRSSAEHHPRVRRRFHTPAGGRGGPLPHRSHGTVRATRARQATSRAECPPTHHGYKTCATGLVCMKSTVGRWTCKEVIIPSDPRLLSIGSTYLCNCGHDDSSWNIT